MNFYFCETCGRSLTELDIEAGIAKNKKLKGVFCTECANGVTTMESLPMTDQEACKILAATEPPSKLPRTSRPPGKRRSSSAALPFAENSVDAQHARRDSLRSTSSPTPYLKIVVAGMVAVMIVVGGMMAFGARGRVSIKTESGSRKRQEGFPRPPSAVVKETSREERVEKERPTEVLRTTPLIERKVSIDSAEALAEPKGFPAPEPKTALNASATGTLPSPEAPGVGATKQQARDVKPDPSRVAPTEADAKSNDVEQAKAHELEEAKAKFATHLNAFEEALLKGELAAACQTAERTKSDPLMQRFAQEVAALVVIGEGQTAAVATRQQAFEALADGKNRTFQTAKGAVTGVVSKVEGDTLRVKVEGRINKQLIEYETRVKRSDLTPACRARLLGKETPATSDEWVVEAIRRLAAKDLDGAENALAEAGAHPLVVLYRARVADLRNAQATGGTLVRYAQDGQTYVAHIFTACGTLTVTRAGKVDYLVVAGGGGGAHGGYWNAGGGAGGMLTGSTKLAAQSYAITVGHGGNGGGQDGKSVASGGDSSLGTLITAQGGGKGGQGADRAAPPATGGSGGGSASTESGAAGTPGQGHPGGRAMSVGGVASGGGGGGAGGPGGDGSPNGRTAGIGGAGASSSITGASVTYAVGGYGSARYNGAATDAVSGAANTGNGGNAGKEGRGGSGGSGMVVVRYVIADEPTK